jgi:hypothetical protein
LPFFFFKINSLQNVIVPEPPTGSSRTANWKFPNRQLEVPEPPTGNFSTYPQALFPNRQSCCVPEPPKARMFPNRQIF